MIKRICIVIQICVFIGGLWSIQQTAELMWANQQEWYAIETYAIDAAQERALYEECMHLTYQLPAGRPVMRFWKEYN